MIAVTTFIALCSAWTASAQIQKLCPEGFALSDPNGNECYAVGRANVSYEDAFYLCKGMDGWLADITKNNWDFMSPLLQGYPGVKGAVMYYTTDRFLSTGATCKFLDTDENGEFTSYKTVKLPCVDVYDMLYVCARDAFLKDCVRSSCYYLFQASKDDCDLEGYDNKTNSHLARIDSYKESESVKDLLQQAPNEASSGFESNNGVRISGSDELEEGKWVLDNGQEMTFFDWEDYETNNADDGEDCVTLKLGGRTGMNDVDCDNWEHTRNYLCEAENEA